VRRQVPLPRPATVLFFGLIVFMIVFILMQERGTP